MTKDDFLRDLKRLYQLLKERSERINSLYSLLDITKGEALKPIRKIAKICSLKLTRQNKIAILSRLINLREDLLILSLDDRDEKEREAILAQVYGEVADFHIANHEELLLRIEQEKLLSPFYRALLRGVHEIGKTLTLWQPKWTKHIIHTINPSLLQKFGKDELIARFLSENHLFDTDSEGKDADRSYSALVFDGGEYKNCAYATLFAPEVKTLAEKIEDLIKTLEGLNDDIYGAKEAYIVYFAALKAAFLQTDTAKLINAWQDVDRAWMDIRTPLQVAHPLEYYEDHYKKAVALEWDVRLQNPNENESADIRGEISAMYREFFTLLDPDKKYANIYQKSMQNVDKTALFISRPLLYYAAQFNGLFSAQVVPNDEKVSGERGKKIFAYADNVLDSIRAKPFMKILSEVFGAEFIKKERELIFKKSEIWHKVYQYTTIGHEFGHILWIDSDTENEMNKSGVFKNIEEFKATSGGLVAFFKYGEKDLESWVINDTIKRSAGLISWMKSAEVEPYYCEALIHLSGLFECGVLSFGEKLLIDKAPQNIEHLKEWYFALYQELGAHYLEKKDAKEFLDAFAQKEDGIYMPADKSVRRFVEYYWHLHTTIGRETDDKDDRKNWL